MAKRRVMSGADVCRILRENGFALARQRGSHMVMQRRVGTSTITVPVPAHRELRDGTLASIIRQSGLPKEIFKAN